MVGHEEGNGHQRSLVSLVHFCPKCGRVRAEGIGVPECCPPALESQPRANDGNAENQAPPKASAPSRLYDAIRGSPVLVESKEDKPFSAVLPDWLVHWFEAERDNRPQVVDGES